MLIFQNDPFEAFEPLYEELAEGGIDETEIERIIKSRIENWGFKDIYTSQGAFIEAAENSADKLEAELKKILEEDGTVIYWRNGHNSDGGESEFIAVREADELGGEAWEVHVAIINEDTHEYAENDLITDWDKVCDYLGLLISVGNETIDGVVQKVRHTRMKGGGGKWFGNAVWIPQPFGMRFPRWLTEKIRKGLQAKAKL